MLDDMPDQGNQPTLLDIARAYVNAGISIIPVKLDQSKKADLRTWNPYREKFATDGELRVWFGFRSRGIAIVCGVLSGGLEVLDFDHDAEVNFTKFCRMIPPELYLRLCVVRTGSGGYHVIYRSPEVSGNTKIAKLKDDSETLIESRGDGGYIVAVGSPKEVHESNQPYVQVLGKPLPELPEITANERKILWHVAATFDQRDPEVVRAEYVRKRAAQLKDGTPRPLDLSKPSDDFDSRADWFSILTPHGWTSTDGVTWKRPGKSGGGSAKLNRNPQGVLVLTVFSNNAAPLTAGSYGPFRAYKVLFHNGDFHAAIKAVRDLGCGRRSR